jgi:hypothetical protein
MGLKRLVVMQVTAEYVGGYGRLGNPVKLTNLKNVVVVEQPQQ